MMTLIKRHLLVFLRDRWSAFFSFLSVIIIILLYALFLMEMLESNFPETIRDTDAADHLLYSWLMSGVLMVSTVTVPLGFLAVMINDKSEYISNDFFVAPLRRFLITLSYLIAALIVTLALALINLIAGQLIIFLNVGELLDFPALVKLLGVTALSSALFTSMLYVLVSVIRSQNAHGTLSSIVGTLIGFVCGIYVPIGVFGSTIQSVLNALPFMQMSALFRKVYMKEAMDTVFAGLPDTQASYEAFYGVDIELFSTNLSLGLLAVILVGWTLLFVGLSAWRVKSFRT